MSRKFGGTGLGLSISKRLAEAMGGAIEIDSVLEKGSTFRFTVELPASPMNAGLETANRLVGVRALIVSGAGSSQTLERQLAPEGALLTFVADAETALRQYKTMLGEYPAAVVLVDDNIAGAGGLWLAQQIRRLSAPPAALILLASLSASTPQSELEVFDRVITKPARSGVLVRALAELTRAPNSPPKNRDSEVRELPFSGIKILLAEDNPVNQKLACRLLQRMGVDVHVANNGAEALQALQADDFDAVLMDCQMPELDGYEATRQLRDPASGVRNSRITVIALTAHALATDRAKCLAAGMDDYLTKPINPALLQRALAKSLPARREALSHAEAHSLFDEPALMSRTAEDRDFARELIALFIKTGGDTLWELTHCGADTDAVRRLAHSLKGSAGSASASDVAACAAHLERVAGSVDAVAALLALETSFRRTVAHWRRIGWIVQEFHPDADMRERVAK